MKIRAKTFEQWLKANFTRVQLNDIASHGACMGFAGMIYYTETAKLYAKFKEEIWEHLVEESDQCGYSNPLAYLATLSYAKYIDDAFTLENWLVWHVAESISDRITPT